MKSFSLLLLIPCLAFGKCVTSDQWKGADKALHFAGGAAVAMVATMHTRDPMQGFMWGAGVGLAKEVLDSTGNGNCSAQDFLVTVAGAGIGAVAGKWLIIPKRDGLAVAYRTEF